MSVEKPEDVGTVTRDRFGNPGFAFAEGVREDVDRMVGTALRKALESAVAFVVGGDAAKVYASRPDVYNGLDEFRLAGEALRKAWQSMPPEARTAVRVLAPGIDMPDVLARIATAEAAARRQSLALYRASQGNAPKHRPMDIARAFARAYKQENGHHVPLTNGSPPLEALRRALWFIKPPDAKSEGSPRELLRKAIREIEEGDRRTAENRREG
jgi:hypothetical protein